jgi:hypothetical protein
VAFNSISKCPTGNEHHSHGWIVETGPGCALLYSNPDFMRTLSPDVVISQGGKQTNGRPRGRCCDQRQAEVFGMFGLGQNISSATDTQELSLLHQAADLLGMDRESRKIPGLENSLRFGRGGQPVTLSGIQRHVINYTHFY